MANNFTRGQLTEIQAGTMQPPTFKASTFRTPGRAGTAGQNIFSLHNATGSLMTVSLKKLTVDITTTVVKAVTVLPPAVRLYKVTVLPTNGTAVTKVPLDSTSTASSASVTVLQDASADGTSSASALTATIPAGAVIAGEFAPRLITAVGDDGSYKIDLVTGSRIKLNALEGVVVVLDYVLATQNPITDMWLVEAEWEEVTA